MIDPFCIGLLTLWLAQADPPTPDAPGREPQSSTDAAGLRGHASAGSTRPYSGPSRQPIRRSMPCARPRARWR